MKSLYTFHAEEECCIKMKDNLKIKAKIHQYFFSLELKTKHFISVFYRLGSIFTIFVSLKEYSSFLRTTNMNQIHVETYDTKGISSFLS